MQKINTLILNQEGQDNYDAYSEIELTDEEKKIALFEARRSKYVQQKKIEYFKKLNNKVEYKSFTPTELFKQVQDAGFIIDEFNKEITLNMCRYFCGDINGQYNLRKGIMLYGPVGCYKTSLMKFFTKNQSNSFMIYPVNDISTQFTKDGHEVIQKYKELIKTNNPEIYFGQKEIGICFDDFGTEVDKKHYGNESNVMAEIILCRFANHEKLFSKTHFTTNLNADMIEERYGNRVKSRLREMVNLVAFPDNSPDRRK